jgi:hypothetical protein
MCWNFDGSLWNIKGTTTGRTVTGSPINGLRIYMEAWEELGGSRCSQNYIADSGWKYNITSFDGINGSRSIVCTGSGNLVHGYAAKDTHYFAQGGVTAITGYKQ